MTRAIKVLLQTTIPTTVDDWSIARFGLLANRLRAERDNAGQPLFDVTMRDREPLGAPDSVISTLGYALGRPELRHGATGRRDRA
jgi:hypothetical protein